MNKTARIQASFSLPEVFLEDKIERMGKNQTKMNMPKKRRTVKSSIPGVYAVQLLLCSGLCPLKESPPVNRELYRFIVLFPGCYER